MRYFTKELWSRINHCDESIRIKAEEEWNSNSLAYQQQFAEVKKYLSRKFLKSYLARNGLHDYAILRMFVIKKSETYSCELQLFNGRETVLVVMDGIKAIHIDINSFHYCVQGKLTWGYDEFEINPDKSITLSVLCDEKNEMLFEFTRIKLTNQ